MVSDGPIPSESAEEELYPADLAIRGVERRRQRLAQRRRRNRQLLTGVVAGVAIVMLAAGGVAAGWRWASGAAQPAYIPARSSAPNSTAVARPMEPKAALTPLFAQRKDVMLRLPVSVADLTEVGFHQASYSYAMAMKTELPDASNSQAKKEKGTGRDKSAQQTGEDVWLVGSVLRMWRSRPGKPNTAADVGAKAGSQVVSPITGTVLLVKPYKLYDKYADYELHIRPDADTTVDLVMIHVKDPVVKAGDRVIAGISPLGKVRKLSDRIRHQLGHYTSDKGDHVHLQLNDTTDPKYKGLKDAPELPGS